MERASRREVQAGSGYLSMNPKQQHFGVGQSRSVDVQIIWPNGERQTLPALAANASYTVHQGVGVVDPARASEVSQLDPVTDGRGVECCCFAGGFAS